MKGFVTTKKCHLNTLFFSTKSVGILFFFFAKWLKMIAKTCQSKLTRTRHFSFVHSELCVELILFENWLLNKIRARENDIFNVHREYFLQEFCQELNNKMKTKRWPKSFPQLIICAEIELVLVFMFVFRMNNKSDC